MRDFVDELLATVPHLRRFAFVLTGDAFDADDLVQQTVERALTKRTQYRSGSPIHSWLLKIMQNIFLDAKRAETRRPIHLAIDDHDGALEPIEAEGETQVFAQQVMALVAELPKAQRLVIASVVVDGRTYEETAGVLNIPIGTVMSRMARARKTIYTRTKTVRSSP
ncbi:MAG: RNA polymerase sigma factor [Pseudomonadota bacterium]